MTAARWLVVALSVMSAPAWAADTVKPVADGITLLQRTTATPWVIHALTVDLTAPGVSLGATRTGERKRTTSNWAWLVGATAAVNGCFFSYSTYATTGLAAGGGAAWPDTKDDALLAALAFDRGGRVELRPPAEITAFDPSWMEGVVSGRPQLVAEGVKLGTNPSYPSCGSRNPRTAVGLSQDRRRLILVVVDGRSSASAGMTCTELAALMSDLGAYDAVNLDGGGSSAMYVKGTGVVNEPSDGSERVVGNHLAVFAPPLGTVGTVEGTVHVAGDPARRIEGAEVSIAGGERDTTNANGAFRLRSLPGALTVTATKAGYAAATVDVTLGQGGTVAVEIALQPDEMVGADAGAPAELDAAVAPGGDEPDPTPDAAVGCAIATRGAGGLPLLLFLLAAVARRRRPGSDEKPTW